MAAAAGTAWGEAGPRGGGPGRAAARRSAFFAPVGVRASASSRTSNGAAPPRSRSCLQGAMGRRWASPGRSRAWVGGACPLGGRSFGPPSAERHPGADGGYMADARHGPRLCMAWCRRPSREAEVAWGGGLRRRQDGAARTAPLTRAARGGSCAPCRVAQGRTPWPSVGQLRRRRP